MPLLFDVAPAASHGILIGSPPMVTVRTVAIKSKSTVSTSILALPVNVTITSTVSPASMSWGPAGDRDMANPPVSIFDSNSTSSLYKLLFSMVQDIVTGANFSG